MEITIRRLAALEEYAEAEQLLQVCWQTGPHESIPSHLMLTIQHEAGLVLGAFTPDQRMIGFLLGFLSREGDRLKHHSHMTGVHPEFRDHGIAYRLKLAQREQIIAQGLDLCTWTYDPLECRNAVLNIAKLGAVARSYRRNLYGQLLGDLNAALPTDRLVVRWEVLAERVRRCVATGARVAAAVAPEALSEVRIDAGVPVLAEVREPAGQPLVGLQIPARFQEVKRASGEVALAWRMGTRAFFERAFAAGYTLVNITPDPQRPADLALYTLEHADSAA